MKVRSMLIASSAAVAVAAGPPLAAAAVPNLAPAATSADNAKPVVERPINLKPDSSGKVNPSAFPTAANLFTLRELRYAFPDVSTVQSDENTLKLTLKNSLKGSQNQLIIDVVQVGPTASVASAWSGELAAHKARSDKNKGLYTFFPSKAHGVQESFSDGTTAHLFVQREGGAALLRISAIGFVTADNDYDKARKQVANQALPRLVEEVGAKVAAARPETP